MGDKKKPIPDEISDNLGALGLPIRIEIIRILKQGQTPIIFSDLAKELATFKTEGSKLAYHLTQLRTYRLIAQDENGGYYLTPFGDKMGDQIEIIQQLVESKKSQKLIRTSRYTFEPFDERKIEQALVKEANMPLEQAKQIAHDVKARLEKAKVNYLTAPLIREYINALLIEQGYEDYRHKLTRLGLPPYNIQLLLSQPILAAPLDLIQTVGKASLEQFVLLNQLNQSLADLLLSGRIAITDLGSFCSKPLRNSYFRNRIITLVFPF